MTTIPMTALVLIATTAAGTGDSRRLARGDGMARSADGIRIAYHVEGHGEPAVVFVHCWAGDRHLWDAQLQRLAGHRRVVSLDLAGHGASGGERRDWTIGAFGEDVRAVVQALDLRRAVLVGHSLGGPVILEAARLMPNRVAGLIPVDTLLNVDETPNREEVESYLSTFREDFKTAAEKFLREWMFVPTTDPELAERLVRQATAAPPDVAVAVLRSAWTYEAGPALREIRAPIQAINSDRFPTDLEAARRYAPQYQVTFMNGVGHYLMLEAPDRFATLLNQALGRMSGPDRKRH